MNVVASNIMIGCLFTVGVAFTAFLVSFIFMITDSFSNKNKPS